MLYYLITENMLYYIITEN